MIKTKTSKKQLDLIKKINKFVDEKHIPRSVIERIMIAHGIHNPWAQKISRLNKGNVIPDMMLDDVSDILDEYEDEIFMVPIENLIETIDYTLKRNDVTILQLCKYCDYNFNNYYYRKRFGWMPIGKYNMIIDKMCDWEEEYRQQKE